jgi:hypothetical protein
VGQLALVVHETRMQPLAPAQAKSAGQSLLTWQGWA